MNSLSMSYSMRSRAHEKLFILGMVDRKGELTELGTFAAELGLLLLYARKFEVVEDALTIFAMLERGQTLTSKERRIRVPHPDGDMHSLLNVLALSSVAGSSNQ